MNRREKINNNRKLRRDERELRSFRRGGDVRVVIAYPNRYWVAMSNLGFQTVYRLFSDVARFAVERAYIPEDDSSSISTFESGASLSQAEIIALSVSFETDYSNVLRLIEAAGSDLEACVRGASQDARPIIRPLIIGGGASLTLNPEPIADFFDAIVIGEGEEVIEEIAQCYLSARDTGASFDELLAELAKLDGVYVPRFYTVSYEEDDTIRGFSEMSGASRRVARRIVTDLDRFPTTTVIQTPNTEFKSMFMTETGRGCEVGCRFCVAGYMYRPTRKRSREVIRESIQLGLETSDSIGFVGAAVSSHPAIAELAAYVGTKGSRAALSSIMSQKVTPELASSLSESEYKTVALAPEAGSEELRFRTGKRVCDEQIIDAVQILAEEGIRNFKLYFMVGLPGESLDDVEAIGRLVARIRDRALLVVSEQKLEIAPRLFLSVNPFIPKAWTPFQRHPMIRFAEVTRRIGLVREAIGNLSNVEMKHESPRESYFQALMSRGDRRVGALLLWLHQHGFHWKSLVKHGDRSLVPGVPAADFYVHRLIGENEKLPWEIVDLQIKRTLLEREYQRAFVEDVTPLITRARREYRKMHELREGSSDEGERQFVQAESYL